MCPDEETILGYFRGQLSADARGRVELHLADCEECRVLVSVLARSSVPEGVLAATVTPPQGSMHEMGVADTEAASSSAPRVDGSGGRGRSHPPAPVKEGEVVAGKYKVERVLGAGGMGIVVRAHQVELDRPVALKFLLPQACEAPGAVDRFLREGRAAAKLESEHVARVLDTGTLGGAPFLVMEYLEGSDLADVLAARGRLPPHEAVAYVLQACEAIAEAHAAGIVHRDIKPSNLFLTRRPDGTPRVKVLDFGISKADGGSRPDLTASAMMMGSPRYMSPEQMVSARDADARTDVWALGVVLFELVTGRPVWDAATVQGLCALIATAPAPRLRTFAPDAPLALEHVVASCLVKEKDGRMASVAELMRALTPLVAATTPRSGASPYVSSALPAPPEPPASRRVVLALAAVIALSALAGAVIVVSQPSPARGPSATAGAAAEAPDGDAASASEKHKVNGDLADGIGPAPSASGGATGAANASGAAASASGAAAHIAPPRAAPRTKAASAARPPAPPTKTASAPRPPAPPAGTGAPSPASGLTDRK
ncbi:MAG: protein kinase [Myxococcales bacterium]|nr:protein kinase [Myxococcales bacterium]